MSYAQGSYQGPKLIGAGVGAAMAIRLFWTLLWPHHQSPSDVEAAIMADAQTRPMYETMQRSYPAEFNGLVQEITRRANAGDPAEAVTRAGTTYLTAAEQRHRPDMIQAPHAAFHSYRSAEITLIATLQQTDPAMCASFLSQGEIRRTGGGPIDAPPTDLHRAEWQAFAAGHDSPAGRRVTAPSPADIAAIADAVWKAGFSAQEVAALGGPARLAALPIERQCALGLAVRRAVDALPGDRGDAVSATMIPTA